VAHVATFSKMLEAIFCPENWLAKGWDQSHLQIEIHFVMKQLVP